MTNKHIAKAAEFAPIIERVHGENHPELTEVRKLTQKLTDANTNQADVFAQLREVTNNYALPVDACEAYTWTYQALQRADAAHSAA